MSSEENDGQNKKDSTFDVKSSGSISDDSKSPTTANAKRCKQYRKNMSSSTKLEIKEKDRLRKVQKIKTQRVKRTICCDNNKDKDSFTADARVCKRYRKNKTSEEKLMVKAKDRERKQAAAASKKKVQPTKPKKRSSQAILKRKEKHKDYMRLFRTNMANDALAERRRKDLIAKKAFHTLTDPNLYPLHCLEDTSEVTETDRTYIASKVRKFKENLITYGASDCSGLFGKMLNEIKWHICYVCKTRVMGLRKRCYCCKDNRYVNSKLMEIGDIPPELACLTTIEQLLIAKVHPVVQVYRLRGGQLGYSGHVINFFQDVKTFATILPHSIEMISGIVKVCCETQTFHKDFCIRKKCVLEALLWLKANNPLYNDIEIDNTVLRPLPDEFQFEVDVSYTTTSNIDSSTDEKENIDITSSSIPQPHMISPEDKLRHNLKWPDISHNPIDEMGKSGYIAKAFPTLFPKGIGDISEVVNEKISSREYFQYLMNYHDGRFSSHKIFSYFAWNSVMRWECMTKGTVYMRKHPELKKVNVELLKELLKTKTNLGKDVMVYSSSIRSTRNFWYTRSSELQDMVHQIDLPTIFFTLSAADFHWPRLYDLLKDMYSLGELSETERHKLMFNNPKVCSDYFYEAAEIFINEIMILYFNVKDHWYRYEWQLRGSPHVHGVFWMSGAVNVKELQMKFNEVKERVIEYFDRLISCANPNTNYVITSDHPCRVRIQDVVDHGDDLAALVNTVQRHTVCSLKTCLKLDRHGIMKCKHHFPKILREKSDIVLSERKYYEFEGKRNDDRLNKFNEFVMSNWRGNHDFTGVLSPGGFTHYIAKYAAKPEVKSSIFHDIFLSIVNKCSSKVSAKSAVQKTLMSSLVERDYSAQEVHHLLSGHKLYSCSRSFVTLNLSSSEWYHHMNLNSFESDNFQDNCNSLLNSYSERPIGLAKVCLLDFLKLYNTKTFQRKRGRPSIVRVFPKLNLSDRESAEHDSGVSRQLCILLCHWKTLSDLPSTDEEWHVMKTRNKLHFESLPYYNERLTENNLSADLTDDEDDTTTEKSQDDWMKILTGDDVNLNSSDIGSREIDLSFDWKFFKTTDEEQIQYQSFVKDHKQKFTRIVPILPSYINFNSEQNEILAYVDKLVETYKVNSSFSDLKRFMVCQANAGCGKTVTIQGIVHLVTEKCGDDSILVVAPTASAAVNAGGRTIHSTFHVSVGKEKKNIDLSGDYLHKFQQEFLNVHFIIIDEFSMVGCRMFNLINRRCMQMRNSSDSFGGCAVLLFGDVKQLPPVGDTSLCKSDVSKIKGNAIDGYNLFRCLEDVKLLKTCHRQSDIQFCTFLENISHGICTDDDKLYLRDRFDENVSNSDEFLNAIHLFMRRSGVHTYNENVIKCMNIPIINIPADNNSAIASSCSDDLACNLLQNLYLGIGVRVMLRANIWTDVGLVNGAFGNVISIIYNKDNETAVPDYILIKFDNYTGPVTDNGCVPVPRILRSWYMLDHYCTRIQFPLDLAYATTYHKSQGLTIPKCVIHIDEKEMMPGMYYVALSRVRRKVDLIIAAKYEDCPLFNIKQKLYDDRNLGEQWLLAKASV